MVSGFFGIRTGLLVLLPICWLSGCDNGGGGGGNGGTILPPDNTEICNVTTGLNEPLPACTGDAPCTRIASELNVSTIEAPTITPNCDLAVWDERIMQDVLGFTRYACSYRPPGTSTSSKRPLVLWFHPGGQGTADLAATETHILEKAESFDLTGDATRPGFILLSVQGRNLHFPTAKPRDGQHHDFYFRDLNVPSTNPDIANVDKFIDDLVAEGVVDTNRIYVMGWSNGAFFSQLYGIGRHETATENGNRVAAAAVFSAASPFDDISWDPFNNTAYDEGASCVTDIPASNLPISLYYRTSDSAVACNQVQASCFDTEPGYTVDAWLNASASYGLTITGTALGGLESNSPTAIDVTASGCTNYNAGCPVGDCSTNPRGDFCYSIVNHARWPDGDYNNPPMGVDREVDMLEFLKNNPLL